jgi:hypothetical protein
MDQLHMNEDNIFTSTKCICFNSPNLTCVSILVLYAHLVCRMPTVCVVCPPCVSNAHLVCRKPTLCVVCPPCVSHAHLVCVPYMPTCAECWVSTVRYGHVEPSSLVNLCPYPEGHYELVQEWPA